MNAWLSRCLVEFTLIVPCAVHTSVVCWDTKRAKTQAHCLGRIKNQHGGKKIVTSRGCQLQSREYSEVVKSTDNPTQQVGHRSFLDLNGYFVWTSCWLSTYSTLSNFLLSFCFLGTTTLSLALQVVGQPLQTLVETISRGGAGSLDVPLALAERVKSELIGDLSSVHGVGQILLVGKDEEESITELILVQHALKLLTSLADTVAIVGIDNEDDTLSVLEVYLVQVRAKGRRQVSFESSSSGWDRSCVVAGRSMRHPHPGHLCVPMCVCLCVLSWFLLCVWLLFFMHSHMWERNQKDTNSHGSASNKPITHTQDISCTTKGEK